MNKGFLRSHPHLGVFTRNHLGYLEGAAEAHRASPTRPIAFRSQKRWATAREILSLHHLADLYMAPVGGEGMITHVGKLHHVHLDPREGEAEVEALLNLSLPETRQEGLWEGKVTTVYLITHSRRLDRPFPITELVKAADDSPISADYGYGYAIVHQHRPSVAVEAPVDARNYGFCRYSNRWVPRDEMVAVNVKAYDENNEEVKVRIRVSRSAYAEFWEYVRSLEWDNVLVKRDALPDDAAIGE